MVGLLMMFMMAQTMLCANRAAAQDSTGVSARAFVHGEQPCYAFCRRLRAAKTFAVTAHHAAYLDDELGLLSLNTSSLLVQRPARYAVRGGPCLIQEKWINGRRQVTQLGTPYTVCVSDGIRLLVTDPRSRLYSITPAHLEADIRDNPTLRSIAMGLLLSPDVLASFSIDASASAMREDVVFARIDKTNSLRPKKHVLTFSRATGELRRYSTYLFLRAGDPGITEDRYNEETRVDFTDWRLNHTVLPNDFAVEPPSGYSPTSPILRTLPRVR